MSNVETPNFEDMPIAKLREYAAHMRVAVAKTATKADIIEALHRKLNGKIVPEFADSGTKLKPGYARITVMSDPMPGASNIPVFLNCNGYACTIPRDVEVIVPMRVVRTLNDAKVMRRKQTLVAGNDGRETFKETSVTSLSYPFQVHEMSPGPEVLTNLEIGKRKTMGPKRRYRKLFGHWPKPRELTRAIEQKLISLDPDEQLSAATEKMYSEEAIN